MLMLDAADVQLVYDLDAAFESVARAAEAHVAGQVQAPSRAALRPDGGELLVMPASIGAASAVKVWYALDAQHGTIPVSSAVMLVLDPELGVEVLMDAAVVTDLRTGAMSGLAAGRLAPSATSLGVIGTGIQARTQILAMAYALPGLTDVAVYSRTEHRRLEFARRVSIELAQLMPDRRISVTPADSPRSLCEGRDVVVLATTSSTPVVDDAWLIPDVLLIGVGSHTPSDAEIPPETVQRAATLVVDTHGGGLDGAGDIGPVIARGGLRRDDVLELGALLRRATDPPRAAVFKSVGFAAADLESARIIARRAIAKGLGHRADIHRGTQQVP